MTPRLHRFALFCCVPLLVPLYYLPLRIKVVVAIALFSWVARIEASTNTAASLSATDIQNAINISVNGDTVQLPAGTNNWTGDVSLDWKNLNFVGVGAGGTVQVIAGRPQWVPNSNPVTQIGTYLGGALNFMQVDAAKTNFVFISGISFSNLTTSSSALGAINFTTAHDGMTGNRFRLTNCKFVMSVTGTGDRGVRFEDIYGLMDHCYFRNYINAGHGFDVTYDPNSFNAVTNWHTPQFYGDTNTMCVETCVADFDQLGDGFSDAYDGQKFLIRYCSITNTVIGWHGADSDWRAPRLWDLNNLFFASKNGFTACGAGICAVFGNCRGGSGVIHDNFADAGWNGDAIAQLKQYRAAADYPDTASSNPSGTFLPTGGLQGPMNGAKIVDGNFAGNGYPGLDQIGRGSFSVNPVVWTAAFATNNYEALESAYFWSNNINGNTSPTASGSDFDGTPIPNIIKQGRDYFDNTPKPGYTPLIYPHPLITGQTYQPTWWTNFGGAGSDGAAAIAVDTSSNSYTFGWFSGTASFGSFNLTANGTSQNLFVAKCDPNGVVLWAHSYGSTGNVFPNAIALDSSRNIFIGGYFVGTNNLGGTNLIAPGVFGQQEIFLAKLDSSGNHVWSQRFGSTNNDICYSLSTDSSGDVIMTGTYEKSVSFGGSTFNSIFGGPTGYLAKYDPNGAHLWSMSLAGGNNNFAQGVAVDPSDNVLIDGYFFTSINLGGGLVSTTGSNPNIFIGKFTSGGVFVWQNILTNTLSQKALTIGADNNSDVVISGDFNTTAFLGGGPITGTAFFQDSYVAKYSGVNGSFIWQSPVLGTLSEEATFITTDFQKNVLLTGYYTGNSTFGGITTITNQTGQNHGFLARYTPLGVFTQVIDFNGSVLAQSQGVSTEPTGNFDVVGFFSGTLTRPSPVSLASLGSYDAFVVHFGTSTNGFIPPPPGPAVHVVITGNATVNGNLIIR